MNIKLPQHERKWLEEQAAAGRFASIDETVAGLMAIADDACSWAKPHADEAHAAAASGETLSLEEAVGDIDAHPATLKR
jgi:hypothetical protein